MQDDLPSPIPPPPSQHEPPDQSTTMNVGHHRVAELDLQPRGEVRSVAPRRALGRAIAALGLVLAAAAALIVGVPSPAEPAVVDVKVPAATQSLDTLITAAMSDYATNDANADSAPQQQVVNGWVARDLLHLIALQNEASAKSFDAATAAIIDAGPVPAPIDQRPAHLLMILVLTLCWVGFWLIVPNHTIRAARA